MSENTIQPISRPPMTDAREPVQTRPTPQTQTAQNTAAAQANTTAARPKPQVEARPASEDKRTTLPISNDSNVSLLFRVDEKTNETTIYLVDRESKKVLRTIPPGELAKLSAGEILKLTA